jgi:hypothetical protein
MAAPFDEAQRRINPLRSLKSSSEELGRPGEVHPSEPKEHLHAGTPAQVHFWCTRRDFSHDASAWKSARARLSQTRKSKKSEDLASG